VPHITLRPYYITKESKNGKSAKCENVNLSQNIKMHKIENEQSAEIMKVKKLNLPLRPENTIPYGRRGTPWKPQNPKNAGPGGSEITKCRFCPFK